MRRDIMILVLLLVLAAPAAFAQSAAELLEKGIYLEETAGRVEEAIEVYRRIVADATAGRASVAEALLRLGLCHLEQGEDAAAYEAFERVLAEYPEQEQPAARAREHLGAGEADRLELLPAPWQDGEVARMTLELASGTPIGVFFLTVDAAEMDGEELWRFRVRQQVVSDADNQALRQVLARRDDMTPVASVLKHTVAGHFEARYGDGDVSFETIGGGGKRAEKLEGLTFDNEQSWHLFRRLPLEVGYRQKLRLFSPATGTTTPVRVEVAGEETITVPAGEFECYRLELDVPLVFWISTGPSRALVKWQASGVVAELEEVSVREGDGSASEEPVGVTLPPDWLAYSPAQADRMLFLLDPGAEAQARMEVHVAGERGDCLLQGAAQRRLIQARASLPDHALRAGSWSERERGGWPAVSFLGDYREGEALKVHYWTFIEQGDSCVDFTLRVGADRFEALRATFDSIIGSYRGPLPLAASQAPNRPEPASADRSAVITRQGTRVNEFTFLLGDAVRGSRTLRVDDAGLNARGRFAADLGAGDLLLILQMQGATIDGEAEDRSWGRVLDYGNAGNWELGTVARVTGHTIELAAPLEHDYDAGGRVQIVRMPRYRSLVVRSGASLTSERWDGTTGGVLAVRVDGELVVEQEAAIDASGRGFRGGRLYPGKSESRPATLMRSAIPEGGEKGEGIAGCREDYDRYGGMYGRGAPANGGGGGNGSNSAGGGGANAGRIEKWTGNGNPDLGDAEWVWAWELESVGFSRARSSGGGRGGYAWSNRDADALRDAPGAYAWHGDRRRPVGGLGGRPLDTSTGRLFLGGGGGAGEADGPNGSAGASGGGLILIQAGGALRGKGRITAGGGDVRPNATMAYAPGDAPGGGGAGGTIVIDAESITGLKLTANGGRGGDQRQRNPQAGNYYYEAEGGGGGGGGGFISLTGRTQGITTEAEGGGNGVTDSPALTEFPPNGATAGGRGLILSGGRPEAAGTSARGHDETDRESGKSL